MPLRVVRLLDSDKEGDGFAVPAAPFTIPLRNLLGDMISNDAAVRQP